VSKFFASYLSPALYEYYTTDALSKPGAIGQKDI